jgi:hypothetical protein
MVLLEGEGVVCDDRAWCSRQKAQGGGGAANDQGGVR